MRTPSKWTRRALLALAIIIGLIGTDAALGRLLFDQTPEPKPVLRKSSAPTTNRLIIVFPGAYAPAEALFGRITVAANRADVLFVENPRYGYDEPTTARVVRDKLRTQEYQNYDQIAVISLSMGTGAALALMEHLRGDGRDAKNIKWIPIAPPFTGGQLIDSGAHRAAKLGWIGPGINWLLQPLMNKFLFANPEPRLGADEESVGRWGDAMRDRFTARAVAQQAAAAARTKIFDEDFKSWLQGVHIAFPLVEQDPVVNNRAAYETLFAIHPHNMTMKTYFGDQERHCSLPEDPAEWNIVLAEMLDAVGFAEAV